MQSRFAIPIPCVRSEVLLCRLVRDKEQTCAGSGSNYGGANPIVYTAEATRGPEAGGGLEAGFEGVEGEEGDVYCCACYAACLRLLVSGWARWAAVLAYEEGAEVW